MVIGQVFAAGTVGGLCAHPLAPTFLTTARRAFPTIQFEQLGAQGADVGYGVEHYEQLNRAAKGALSVEEPKPPAASDEKWAPRLLPGGL